MNKLNMFYTNPQLIIHNMKNDFFSLTLPLHSQELYSIFKLIVLVLHATSCFGLLPPYPQTLQALTDPLHITYPAPNNHPMSTVEHLAAKEHNVSFRSWWRSKGEWIFNLQIPCGLKYACIRGINDNVAQCLWCVNKELFVNKFTTTRYTVTICQLCVRLVVIYP